jgi:3-deoxy-manno-octulosonate cytidylyltransferase (CMP-KDO synthetase)
MSALSVSSSCQLFVDSLTCLKLSCYPVNHTGSNPTKNFQRTTVVVIPARFASTRLPGKALADIAGKPMICWVAERAQAAPNVDRVIVATDSNAIVEAVSSRGFEVVLTAETHLSGTDRIAEVIESIPEAEIIVNLQGDEPLIAPDTIQRAVEQMQREFENPDGAGIVTTWEPIEDFDDLTNFDLVKVAVGEQEQAIYFSRSPIPCPRDAIKKHGGPIMAFENEPDFMKLFRKHTGLYVYRRDVLLQFTRWPQTTLEKLEGLEQLRALEHGVVIRVIEASTSSIGVDTPEDLQRVRELIGEGNFEVSALR